MDSSLRTQATINATRCRILWTATNNPTIDLFKDPTSQVVDFITHSKYLTKNNANPFTSKPTNEAGQEKDKNYLSSQYQQPNYQNNSLCLPPSHP